MQEAQEVLKLGDKDKIKTVKAKLYNFVVSTDIYEKSLLSQKENDIKKLLKDLEGYSAQKQIDSLNKFLSWKVVIPVALI